MLPRRELAYRYVFSGTLEELVNSLWRKMESVMHVPADGIARPSKVLYFACIAVTAVQCKVLFSDWLVCEHNEYNLLCVFHCL